MKTTGNRAKQYQYRHEFRSDKPLRDGLIEHCEAISMGKAEFIRKAIAEKLKRDEHKKKKALAKKRSPR